MKRVLRTPLFLLCGACLALLFGLLQPAFAAPGDPLYIEDFERNNLNPGWTRSNNQRAGISTQTSNSGTRSLFTCCGAVDVTSNAINLSAVPAAELSMWIRIGDDINFNFSEWPDAAGEDLVIQYFDSASGWVPLETFIGGAHAAGTIYNRTYTLPITAMHANFQIRISQTGGSGNTFDYYHVDDVVLTEIAPPTPIGFGSCDDFESGLTNWTVTPISGVANVTSGVNTVNSPSNSLYLRSGQVYVTSNTIDTSTATAPILTLWVRRGQDGLDGYSEDTDPNEDLQIQYLNSANNWILLDTVLGSGIKGEILNLSYALPADAIHANFRIRLYMTGGNAGSYGAGLFYDYWHVDDVCVGQSSSGSLVAYYAQDESSWNGTAGEVIDSSGNALHGTALNGVSTAPAMVCRGGNFNGTNGPVEIVDNALLDISAELTASAWIQPNSLPGTGLMSILSKDTNYEFHITPAGEINWWWNDSTGTVRSLTTTGANIAPGNWYHVAITYSSGQQRIYVNGVQRASGSYAGTLRNNNNPLQIGGDQGITSRLFNGLIDEVRVYAAQQSQAEVNADMAATHPCPTTPIAEYHLDETAWGVVNDSSGSGNNGSTSGTVTPSITSPAIAGNPGTCGYADIPSNTTTTPADAIDSGLDVDTAIGNTGTISFWYKSNAPWINGGDRQLFDATNATTGDYFHLVLQSDQPGRGRLRFQLVDNANNRERARTGNLNIAANTWTHIAVTWDLPADVMNIYINGVLDTTRNTGTTGVLGNMDTLFFGDNRSTVLGRNGTANSANGSFDEIRIYNLVQTSAQIAADMAATHACTASQVHHYRIVHDGSGLTCNPETITVQACMDAACTSFYAGNVSATLDPGGNAVSITDGSGIVSIPIRNNSPGTITLGINGANPAATNATTCLMDNGVTTSNSCDITFSDSGFVFDVPNQTSCATSNAVTISAVRKDLTTQQCVPAFSNRTETLKFWSSYVTPNSGTQSVAVNGNNVSTALPGTDVSLNFDANGQSTITVAYPDAGDMQLNTSYAGAVGTADEGLVMTGNDRFVVVPAKFIVSSGDANADCASGDATCSIFKKAGEAFNLTVSAACANDTVTPNFSATGITLGHNLVAPVGGVAGTLGNGTIDINAADNGSATINNQSIDEVGVFTVSAALDSYLGVTAATPATPLITGLSGNIGRFIPARLVVTGNAPASNNACTSGPTPYTYLGQDFGFATNPILTVSAQNTAGNFTRNYGGPFWKLTGALANRNYADTVGTTAFTPTYSAAAPTLAEANNFDAIPPTLTITGDILNYGRPVAPVNAFASNVDLTIPAADLTDSDGVCYDAAASVVCNTNGGLGNPVDLTIAGITGASLRYGIGMSNNVMDPATAIGTIIVLPVTAQYIDAAGATVTNVDDSCSTISYTNIDTGITTTTAPASPVTFATGAGDLTVTLTADTGGDTGGYSVYTLTWPVWLPGPSTSTAIFGAIPSDNNYLYWNESR